MCGLGGVLLLSGLVVLTCIDQDDARHSFGHTGGMFSDFGITALNFDNINLP